MPRTTRLSVSLGNACMDFYGTRGDDALRAAGVPRGVTLEALEAAWDAARRNTRRAHGATRRPD